MSADETNVGERSKGKMRPRLPRASDMRTSKTEADRSADHDRRGLFTAGNRAAKGSGLKRVTRKAMGDRAATGEAAIVARDARRVGSAVLSSLPSDAAPVRVLVAMHARHVALHAYYTHLAEVAGLDTPEGLKFLEVADRQSQRAERVLVTAQDMARVCASETEKRRAYVEPTWAIPEEPKE